MPLEEKKDFEKPERAANLTLWVVVDTAGALKGLLHTCRRFEYCRDVVVLVSEKTPEDYLAHLRERNYDFHVVGKGRVDLRLALELLAEKYGVMTVLTDTGRVLDGLLLEQGLVSELSLLVHPVIVGKEKAYTMFGSVGEGVDLELVRVKALGKGFVWLVYKVST